MGTNSSAGAQRRRAQALVRAREQRRQRLRIALSAISGVPLLLGILVVAHQATDSDVTAASTTAESSVASAIESVPAVVFDQVGVGTAANGPRAIDGTPISEGGKPKVLYVGAEFCPYCAAERWGVATALARFGTFHNLGQSESSSSDVYPSTSTLSFHGATYASKYIAFTGYETKSNQPVAGGYATLDELSAEDEKLFGTYDAPPYVDASAAGSIPFVLLGGKYLISGAGFDPGVLEGLSHAQIADALADPASDVARAIDGTANLVSAAICRLTDNKPATVCSSSAVTAAAQALGG